MVAKVELGEIVYHGDETSLSWLQWKNLRAEFCKHVRTEIGSIANPEVSM